MYFSNVITNTTRCPWLSELDKILSFVAATHSVGTSGVLLVAFLGVVAHFALMEL